MGFRNRHFERVETNGIQLRVVVEGDGPLVILMHGFPQCWYLWRNQIAPLVEAGWRVAVPDQRGYGRTTGWKDGYDADLVPFRFLNLVRDTLALIHALGHYRGAYQRRL